METEYSSFYQKYRTFEIIDYVENIRSLNQIANKTNNKYIQKHNQGDFI